VLRLDTEETLARNVGGLFVFNPKSVDWPTCAASAEIFCAAFPRGAVMFAM